MFGVEPQEELAPIRTIDDMAVLIKASGEGGTLPEERAVAEESHEARIHHLEHEIFAPPEGHGRGREGKDLLEGPPLRGRRLFRPAHASAIAPKPTQKAAPEEIKRIKLGNAGSVHGGGSPSDPEERRNYA